MIEYKIVIGSPKVVQTKLNQWRHEYHLDFLGLHSGFGDDAKQEITLLISRTKKSGGERRD